MPLFSPKTSKSVNEKYLAFECSGAAGLFFVGKGRRVNAVAANGLVLEMNSETGEVNKEFKVSKKSISSVAHSTGLYPTYVLNCIFYFKYLSDFLVLTVKTRKL